MKRCTSCFHYARGMPTSCPTCGRTYDVRLCSRGHVSSRDAVACRVCQTTDLSVPAGPSGVLDRLAVWTLRLYVGVVGGILLATVILGMIVPLDWPRLGWRFLWLLVMGGVLYRSSILLAGPVTRVPPRPIDDRQSDRSHDTDHR